MNAGDSAVAVIGNRCDPCEGKGKRRSDGGWHVQGTITLVESRLTIGPTHTWQRTCRQGRDPAGPATWQLLGKQGRVEYAMAAI